ncbi:hepatoma-derived growth factor-related protein 2-like [Schistocerca piceifrons]|uniref:hepatoma-derived growth factor-related protein 2-like n=1 Tax=Schistocerca piceifrons TaxID=274613 RepID=UPI001F5F4F6D|nr:hepatoma-derived growth factor-related protein 2-like [Schistocerca piceifrons]
MVKLRSQRPSNMDTEEQQLVSAGNVEPVTSSSTSTLFEDITCENVGAGAQEVVPPPTSPQGDVEKEVVPPPEKQEPESGNLPGGYSLQAILERVLDYQAEFAQQQVERDRQQAERDRRLAENLLAQQAERDRRQAERDQQLVQSLENMKKEIADMEQNYESIPKAVQELTEQVNNLQVANTNRVDEIGVLANRVEKLETDSTQLVEQKWNEQATKIETEFNSWLEVKECEVDKNINSKVQAAIANRGSESFSTAVNSQVQNDVQTIKQILSEDIPQWQVNMNKRITDLEKGLAQSRKHLEQEPLSPTAHGFGNAQTYTRYNNGESVVDNAKSCSFGSEHTAYVQGAKPCSSKILVEERCKHDRNSSAQNHNQGNGGGGNKRQEHSQNGSNGRGQNGYGQTTYNKRRRFDDRYESGMSGTNRGKNARGQWQSNYSDSKRNWQQNQRRSPERQGNDRYDNNRPPPQNAPIAQPWRPTNQSVHIVEVADNSLPSTSQATNPTN